MSEMVERVARALFETDQKEHGFGRGNWVMDGRPMTWEEIIAEPRLANDVQRYRTNAKAAIQAMREPTPDMIEAGWQDGMAGFGEGEEWEPVWKAMSMEWQPIETAPKDGTRILVWDNGCWPARWLEEAEHGHGELGPGWQIFECELDVWYALCADNPTHWMPLPEPPKSL